MAVQAPLVGTLADMVVCLGLGLGLAACYDLGRIFLGDGRSACFVLDLLAFAAAAVLLCGFAAGQSYTGRVRWYLAASLAAGVAAYQGSVAPVTRCWQKRIKWVFSRPFVLLWLLALCPLKKALMRLAGATRQAVREKRQINRKKRAQKQLQKHSKILYNSK